MKGEEEEEEGVEAEGEIEDEDAEEDVDSLGYKTKEKLMIRFTKIKF